MTRPRWRPAYVALGSNLDNPRQHLERAIVELNELPQTRVYRASDIVRSPPLDGSDQPDYLNAVAGLMTGLDPHSLFEHLKRIELAHGRGPDAPRWSARPLDLDLLALANEQVSDDVLSLPHPRMSDRAFVIGPLAQVAQTLRLPVFGTVSALADALDLAQLETIGALTVPCP